MPFTGSIVDCRRQMPGSPAAARTFGKLAATWGHAVFWDWSELGGSEVGLTADQIWMSTGSAADLSDSRHFQMTIARCRVPLAPDRGHLRSSLLPC
jgi:hypothetical protein